MEAKEDVDEEKTNQDSEGNDISWAVIYDRINNCI